MPSPVDTSLQFLSTFTTPSPSSISQNISLRAPSCTHTMLPYSLGLPTMNNEAFAAHFERLAEVIEKFPVTPVDVFYDEKAKGRVVTVHATSKAIFRQDAMDDEDGVVWEYEGEYVFVFTFDASGEKIERIVEFLDGKKALDAMVLVQRGRRNLEQRSKVEKA